MPSIKAKKQGTADPPVTQATTEPPFDEVAWLNALQDTVNRLLLHRQPLLLCSWQVLKPGRASRQQGRAYAPTERLLHRIEMVLAEIQKPLEGPRFAARGLDLASRCFLSRVQSGLLTVKALLGDLAVTRDRCALVGRVTLFGMDLWLSVHLCLLWWRLGHLSKEFAYTRRQVQLRPPLSQQETVPVTGGSTS